MTYISRFLMLGICALGFATSSQAAPVETPSLTVTTLSDTSTNTDGFISLREAIDYVNSGMAPADPVIDFAPGLNGTITLSGQELEIDEDLAITGPTNGDKITVNGDYSSRVFLCYPGTVVGIFDLTITGGVSFSVQDPTGSGGGIINGGFLYLSHCTLTKNGSTFGGGLMNLGGFAAVDSCTFSQNQGGIGGGLTNFGGVAFVQNSTFVGNSAEDGGGLYNTGGQQVEIGNCTFSANKAKYEGGAINNDDFMLVSNCTFGGNTAGFGSGALYNYGGSSSSETAQIGNNIFVGDPTTPNLYSESGGEPILSLGHNLSNADDSLDLVDATDLNLTNPKLGPLQNNGGPTLTYAIPRNSAAFDGGDDSLLPQDFLDQDKDTDQAEAIPYDQRGAVFPRIDGTSVDIGAYELFNNPPTNDSVTPATGSSPTGTARNLTAVYSDVDGATDMTEFRLLVNDTPTEANALCVIYDRVTKRMYLLDDDGVTRKGSVPLGSNNVLSNSQGSINCKTVTARDNGNNTTITWNFTPSASFAGAKNLYLQVTDAGGKQDAYEDLGDWTITPKAPPVNVSVTPAAGHSVADSARLLTAVYSDSDGVVDITEARLLVGATATQANSLCGVYDRINKKMYLLGDDGTTLLGGFAPGSTNVISNSQGSLNCKTSTAVAGTNTLTVGWSFTPATTFTGAKNLYGLVKDKDGKQDGYDDLGDWTIDPNSTPTNVSLAPTLSNTVANTRRDFTTTYSDVDTVGDISEVRFLVNDTANPANALCAIYDLTAKKIYLLDNDGVTRKGGFAPGSANIISNSQGSINCQPIIPKTSGNTVTVNWNFTPNSNFVGTKNVFLSVLDKHGAVDGFEDLGDWIIRAAAAGIQAASANGS